MALKLKEPRGKEIVRQPAADANVLTENFRPGVMERLGLSAASLLADNPRLIHCAVSGHVQDGPMVRRPAHDHVVQAVLRMKDAR